MGGDRKLSKIQVFCEINWCMKKNLRPTQLIKWNFENNALEGRGDLPFLRIQDKTYDKIKQQQQTLMTSKTRCLFVEKLKNKVSIAADKS